MKLVSNDGLNHHCEVKGKGKTDKVIQKGQYLGYISPLLNASDFSNKNKKLLFYYLYF